MKSVPANYAETARRIGAESESTPESDHLDLLGGGLRDAYAHLSASMPENLLVLARRIETRVSGIGETA